MRLPTRTRQTILHPSVGQSTQAPNDSKGERRTYSPSMADLPYDAILLVSFGGPEGPDDVIPFLENVTRGRGIPRERLAQVGEHYAHFGGVSPINEQCRRQRAALERALADAGMSLPVYWGNRNWDPYLSDEIERMAEDGVTRALAVFTSAYSSYSGCRQYRENIIAARAEVAEHGRVGEVALPPRDGQLGGEVIEDGIGHPDVPLRVFKVNRIYFMWHSR